MIADIDSADTAEAELELPIHVRDNRVYPGEKAEGTAIDTTGAPSGSNSGITSRVSGGKRKYHELSDAAEELDDAKDAPKPPRPKGKNSSTTPKALRESKDPWKLLSDATKDYKRMLAPPLEMFHWSRIILDEYTYIDGIDLSMISRLSAARIWALSGTSPTADFHALKSIARLLSIHLGIYDTGEVKSKTILRKYTEESSRACYYVDSVHASDCLRRGRAVSHVPRNT